MTTSNAHSARSLSKFEKHFSSIYGERWPALFQALFQPTRRYVARINRFALASAAPSATTGSEPDDDEEALTIATATDLMKSCNANAKPLTLPPPPRASYTLPLCWIGDSFPPPPSALTLLATAAAATSTSTSTSTTSTSTSTSTAREINKEGLYPYYLMDIASLLPVLALDIQPGDTVADFCAAPGGKSLSLAEMVGRRGKLTCNDISSARKARLGRTMETYLPSEFRRHNLSLTCQDASKWFAHSLHGEAYDRILVDAPCSGERHLLGQPSEMNKWSPGSTTRKAADQKALLSAAVRCLKPGGRVVYSTCSISPAENEEVVCRILARNPKMRLIFDGKGKEREEEGREKEGTEGGGEEDGKLVLPQLETFVKVCQEAGELTGLERNKGGWIILPDTNCGWGPIFFSVLEKRGSGSGGEEEEQEER